MSAKFIIAEETVSILLIVTLLKMAEVAPMLLVKMKLPKSAFVCTELAYT
jgi:hypothetical protein